MTMDLQSSALVLHMVLCVGLWYSVFCRAVREDKSVLPAIRLAFAFLGGAALLALVAPLVWGWHPDPVTLLLLLAMLVVQLVTARHWRHGVPGQYLNDGGV